MAGLVNNHNNIGLNGSKTGSSVSGLEKRDSDQTAVEDEGRTAKAVTDEVSLSTAGKQLNAQGVLSAGPGPIIETPEQAARMAQHIVSAIKEDNAHALTALGSGDVSGLKGLLMPT